jgi:FO synthase
MTMSARTRKETMVKIALSLAELMAPARGLCPEGYRTTIAYSRKVFIPLTQLRRDACGYCTFAKSPREVTRPYLTPIEGWPSRGRASRPVVAKRCLRWEKSRNCATRRPAMHAKLGYASTIDDLAAMCALVLEKTLMLPHVDPGPMTENEPQQRTRCISWCRRSGVPQALEHRHSLIR